MSTEQNHVVLGKGDLTLDAWGNQKTVTPYSLFHGLFTYDVPVKMWQSEVNGVEEDIIASTLVTSVSSVLNVKTAANSGDITYLYSRRNPRYQANRSHHYATSMIIPTPTDNAVEDFGLFTETNGAFFRVNVDGKLYACIQNDGTITHQEEIKTELVVDYSKGNIYDIQYQWRGVGNFKFFIGDPKTGLLKLVHEIKLINTLTGLSIRNPSLPAAFRVTSIGDAGVLQCGCVDISSDGGREGREQYASADSHDKGINGTDVPVLIMRNPLLFGGEINTRDLRLMRITGTSDKRTEFAIWTTRDPTAFTAAAFNNIGNGSFVDKDIAATAVDIAKLQHLLHFKVEANSSERIITPGTNLADFFIVRGDYIVITATVASATCSATVEFGEEV